MINDKNPTFTKKVGSVVYVINLAEFLDPRLLQEVGDLITTNFSQLRGESTSSEYQFYDD